MIRISGQSGPSALSSSGKNQLRYIVGSVR